MIGIWAVASEIASYAPMGGGTWQRVGMKAVPVHLLSRLKELMEEERCR